MHADGAYMGGFTERKEMEKGEGREETTGRGEERETQRKIEEEEREVDRVLPLKGTGCCLPCTQA